MAVLTFVDIISKDKQGYEATTPFRVTPAAFGDTTIPAAADIEALITALYGTTKFSDQIVTSYQVRVVQDAPSTAGGAGNVGTSQALRIRSTNGIVQDLLRIPGLLKSHVVNDPQNPNAVSTSGALWDALRTALEALGFGPIKGSYFAYDPEQIATTANEFDGRRSPLRPR